MASKRKSGRGAFALFTGFDVAASVAGSIGRQIGRLPSTLRKIGGVEKDDGYRPEATDPHQRFLESMEFYGSSLDKLPKLISDSYKEFQAHAVIAALCVVGAALLFRSSPYMGLSTALVALFFAMKALRNAVDNWVVRNQRTASLREFFTAPDIFPRKA